MVHNTYIYSAGHRPCIYPLDPSRRDITDCPEWDRSGAFQGFPIDQFVRVLNRSKIFQGTHSPPNGVPRPLHLKGKEGKALLCGALPVMEEFPEADGYLAPGKEKAVSGSSSGPSAT